MQKFLFLLATSYLLTSCSTMTSVEESSSSKAIHFSNSSSKEQRAFIVNEAQKLVGSKYKYGGTSPRGFDCSGFTSYIYKMANIPIPRSSSAQSQQGDKITAGAAQPGDLLFFKLNRKGKISHVAMVISNNRGKLEVIHSTTSRGVIQERIDNSDYWAGKLLYGRNYID